MVVWLFGIYVICVLLLGLLVCICVEFCLYKFSVWYLDRDVLNKF